MRPQARELNKFWHDGGKGLPPEQAAKSNLARKPAAGVGDGGASWRLKALKRARETAQREGKQLSDVVGDRWGSLSDLTADAMKTRAAPSTFGSLSSPSHPVSHPVGLLLLCLCTRDVKEVHSTVCRHVPSAFLCDKGGCWTYESEVIYPSFRRISSMCG